MAYSDVATNIILVTDSAYSTTTLSSDTSHSPWPVSDGIARSYNPKFDSNNGGGLYRNYTNDSTFSFSDSGQATNRRGNYYNFYAATAQSMSATATGNAPYSICPKGFALPRGGTSNTAVGSFYYLVATTYGLSNSTASIVNLFKYPMSFVPAGRHNANTAGWNEMTTTWQMYQTSTATSSVRSADFMNGRINTDTSEKGYGPTVRCVSS